MTLRAPTSTKMMVTAVAGLVAFVAAASPTRLHADVTADVPAPEPLGGTFVFVGGEAERVGVARAIDKSMRPLASGAVQREELEELTAIAREIDLDDLPRGEKAGPRVTRSFTRSPDGRTLTMSVRISSPELEVPVRYALTYARR